MDKITMGESFAVVVTGMVVVFLVLIILIVIVMLMGAVFSKMKSKPKDGGGDSGKKQEVKAPAKPAEPAKPVTNMKADVEEGIPGDVVAAISAALSCVLGEDTSSKPYVIRSIRRSANQGKSANAWGQAGLVESTRPF